MSTIFQIWVLRHCQIMHKITSAQICNFHKILSYPSQMDRFPFKIALLSRQLKIGYFQCHCHSILAMHLGPTSTFYLEHATMLTWGYLRWIFLIWLLTFLLTRLAENFDKWGWWRNGSTGLAFGSSTVLNHCRQINWIHQNCHHRVWNINSMISDWNSYHGAWNWV